jgi:hypothetical protein
MNCCTEPTVKLVREIGVIEIEYNAITVKDIGWLVLPDHDAMMISFPADIAVATPSESIMAIELSALVHFTSAVTSFAGPLL